MASAGLPASVSLYLNRIVRGPNMKLGHRLVSAIVLPLIACGLQSLLWDQWIKPYVWFLFFPASFFGAWCGGLYGGLGSTAVSAVLAWYVFIPPRYSFAVDSPAFLASVAMFILMGSLFALMFERLHRVQALARAGFDATFEQVAVGIALVAPDGRWLRVNRKLCDIVGYTPHELLQRRFQDITHPDDLNTDLGQVRRMLAGEIKTYFLEKRYVRKDGSIVWANLTVALAWTPGGEPDHFISVVEDISARKAAERALCENQERLREAQRLACLGYWHWDLATGLHTWSEEIYGFYGRDPALAPLGYPEIGSHFTPESGQRLSAAVERCLHAGIPFECDAEVIRPDNTHRWITARGEARRDKQGRVVALQSTVQDVTLRKGAEEELKRRNEELELFNKAALGREMRMLELKREINGLAREQAREPPYDLSFADPPLQDGISR